MRELTFVEQRQISGAEGRYNELEVAGIAGVSAALAGLATRSIAGFTTYQELFATVCTAGALNLIFAAGIIGTAALINSNQLSYPSLIILNNGDAKAV